MRGKYNRYVVNQNSGVVVPFASVEVRNQETNSLITLYSSIVEGLGVELDNPITADENGFITFFCDIQFLKIVASATAGGAVLSTLMYEYVFNPSAYLSSDNIRTKIVEYSDQFNFDTFEDNYKYIRFTYAGAKEFEVTPDAAGTVKLPGTYWNLRNVSSGNLVLAPGSGVTFNYPNGGGPNVATGDTVTVLCVDTDEYDIFGVTSA